MYPQSLSITFEGLKSSFLDQREVSVKDKEIRLSEISTQTNDKEVCQVLSKLDVCVCHDVNAVAIRSSHIPALIKNYNYLCDIPSNTIQKQKTQF